MIHVNPKHLINLEQNELAGLENPIDLNALGNLGGLELEELSALVGEPVDKGSEAYLNGFINRIELMKLDDLSVANSKAILKNTFDRYADCPLLEVERNTLYSSDSTAIWMLSRRSPTFFRDVLLTQQNDFVLTFESEIFSGYKSIPSNSQFGVVNEGSYFISERQFKGRALHSELFYLPMVSN